MFWVLLLAHFIADYPLQPTWMVRNKIRAGVLLLHVSIHFAVSAALSAAVIGRMWPFIAALTVIHFGIDSAKNWFTLHRPRWIAGPYLIDQLSHILSIGLIALAIQRTGPFLPAPLSRPVVVAVLAFLLATYVWLITERVLLAGRVDRSAPDGEQKAWMRLFIRAGMLTGLLLLWNRFAPAPQSAILGLPYPATRSGRRALLVDISVAAAAAAFVIAAR